MSSNDTIEHHIVQFEYQLYTEDKSRNASKLYWVEFVTAYNLKKQQYKTDLVALMYISMKT